MYVGLYLPSSLGQVGGLHVHTCTGMYMHVHVCTYVRTCTGMYMCVSTCGIPMSEMLGYLKSTQGCHCVMEAFLCMAQAI